MKCKKCNIKLKPTFMGDHQIQYIEVYNEELERMEKKKLTQRFWICMKCGVRYEIK